MQFKEKKNIFEFAQSFKEYWSNNSESQYTPSFLVLGKDDVYSCVILVKSDQDIQPIVNLFKIGADINLAAVCMDNKDWMDNDCLSVIYSNKKIYECKTFEYKVEDKKFVWESEKELSFVDKNSWTIMHLMVSRNYVDENISVLKKFGFDEARQYYHNFRSVCSYVNTHYDVFIVDLLSAKHPEWCEADMKLKKLCEYLLNEKRISKSCFDKLIACQDLLGSETFLNKVTEIVQAELDQCDLAFIVSPSLFAERLQKNIFDFKYDLHKSELISW